MACFPPTVDGADAWLRLRSATTKGSGPLATRRIELVGFPAGSL